MRHGWDDDWMGVFFFHRSPGKSKVEAVTTITAILSVQSCGWVTGE